MPSRPRLLWLILLLLCAAAAPRASDLPAPADGWEQLDEARFEAVPETRQVVNVPVVQQVRAPAGTNVKVERLAVAEIFRPPIG